MIETMYVDWGARCGHHWHVVFLIHRWQANCTEAVRISKGDRFGHACYPTPEPAVQSTGKAGISMWLRIVFKVVGIPCADHHAQTSFKWSVHGLFVDIKQVLLNFYIVTASLRNGFSTVIDVWMTLLKNVHFYDEPFDESEVHACLADSLLYTGQEVPRN